VPVSGGPVLRARLVLRPPGEEDPPVHVQDVGPLAVVGERPHDRPPWLGPRNLPGIESLPRPRHREQPELVPGKEEVVVRSEVDRKAGKGQGVGPFEGDGPTWPAPTT